jgi:hypothetical protein
VLLHLRDRLTHSEREGIQSGSSGCSDNRSAVRTTLEKIARLAAGEREAVLGLLMILSGL